MVHGSTLQRDKGLANASLLVLLHSDTSRVVVNSVGMSVFRQNTTTTSQSNIFPSRFSTTITFLYTFTLRLRHASQAAVTGFNLGLDMVMFGTGARFDLSFEGRIRRIVPVLTMNSNAQDQLQSFTFCWFEDEFNSCVFSW